MVCYDQNLQKHKYLSTISIFLHKAFRTGLVFLSQSKWVETVVCYNQNLQKHKYLSTISIFLHKTFRTGLVFPRRLKWVQTVVCYNQNLQKHKYLSTISIFLHENFRTGLIFQASWNESKQWYATIKTYKNINISAWYQYFCTKPSEQGLFFQVGPKNGILQSKLTKT